MRRFSLLPTDQWLSMAIPCMVDAYVRVVT